MKKQASKNILLTGGAGFIGSHLIEALLKNNYQVLLLKKKSNSLWRVKNYIGKISTYNIEEVSSLDFIFKKHKVNMIIHLAGKYIKFHRSNIDILEMNKSNIDFPKQLLEVAVKNNVLQFINTGTFFEYKLYGIISEESKIEPYDYYAETKIAFEKILKQYTQNKKIKAITLKLFSPYGEKDNKKIIPLIIESLITKKEISVTKGDQELCFTYVGDIVSAYLKAIKFLDSKAYLQYENFNIGADQSFSIKQVIKEIENISQKKLKVKFGAVNNKKDEVIKIKCNLTKAKKMLKWYPKISLEEGLKKTYNYYNILLTK